jgi:hypothetical protein
MRSLLFLSAVFIFASCNHNNDKPEENKDSAGVVIKKLKLTDTLNELFIIKNEEQMKEVFGNKNVKDDTLWGVEGAVYPGTKLFAGTDDEVFISWTDTAKHANVSSIRIACQYDEGNDNYNCESRWRTASGVHLGTKMSNLVDLNGKDFVFYGLGWDYGGTIVDWKKGRLAYENIAVTLGVDNMTDEQRKFYPKLLGDQEFSSGNPYARILDPIVLEVILSKN